MLKIIFKASCYIVCIPLFISCANKNNEKQEIEESLVIESDFLNKEIISRSKYLLSYPVDSTAFPRSMEQDQTTRGVKSKDWTSGFFPGSLMFLYELTSEKQFLDKALEWVKYVEKEKYNDRTHDMGFKVNCSFGNALKLTNNEAYAKVMVESANTLITRFNPKVGCIKSWDFGMDKWQYPVIIDNMMNLELLFEATQLSGDSTYYKIAVLHANNTMQNHFRSDNSSYHVLDYDPETGEVLQRLTHQGYSAESAWSRGQAWGLYGFTMAYRYTKDTAFLNQAIKIAAYITSNPMLPADQIPYWDMNDPSIPSAPRDASAAAVTASALIELDAYAQDSGYKVIAESILKSLSSKEYLLEDTINSPFILNHSTGNMPKTDEVDLPINYADYYFLEAVTRLNK